VVCFFTLRKIHAFPEEEAETRRSVEETAY
jgi:hypothetical protein